MRLLLLPAAELDLDEIVDYHDRQGEGLGSYFLEQFKQGMSRVMTYPQGWQTVDGPIRQHRLNRFPYIIIYRFDPTASTIAVEAIRHTSREPRA